MTPTDAHQRRARQLDHDRALADWIEAEALVAALRRSSAAAAVVAADRARAASVLRRFGRTDAFAVGVADAAELLAHRAEAERRRLEEAVRAEVRLRLRVSSARCALATCAACAGRASAGETGRASCG